MTVDGLNYHFIVPVFYFLAITLFFLTVVSILTGLSGNPGFLVLGCVCFILSYNAWFFGQKLRKS
jgi:hypothetical protein